MTETRAAFSWAVGVVAFWIAWLSSSAFAIPVVWYLPIERRFVFTAHPPGLAMCMFGQLIFAAAVGLGVGGLASRVVRKRDVPDSQVWLSVGWCVLLLCFVVGYYAFALWGRIPVLTIAPEIVDGR